MLFWKIYLQEIVQKDFFLSTRIFATAPPVVVERHNLKCSVVENLSKWKRVHMEQYAGSRDHGI